MRKVRLCLHTGQGSRLSSICFRLICAGRSLCLRQCRTNRALAYWRRRRSSSGTFRRHDQLAHSQQHKCRQAAPNECISMLHSTAPFLSTILPAKVGKTSFHTGTHTLIISLIFRFVNVPSLLFPEITRKIREKASIFIQTEKSAASKPTNSIEDVPEGFQGATGKPLGICKQNPVKKKQTTSKNAAPKPTNSIEGVPEGFQGATGKPLVCNKQNPVRKKPTTSKNAAPKPTNSAEGSPPKGSKGRPESPLVVTSKIQSEKKPTTSKNAAPKPTNSTEGVPEGVQRATGKPFGCNKQNPAATEKAKQFP